MKRHSTIVQSVLEDWPGVVKKSRTESDASSAETCPHNRSGVAVEDACEHLEFAGHDSAGSNAILVSDTLKSRENPIENIFGVIEAEFEAENGHPATIVDECHGGGPPVVGSPKKVSPAPRAASVKTLVKTSASRRPSKVNKSKMPPLNIIRSKPNGK